ncbi:MAG: hypothetical protein MJD61_13650, partial [Proteobacteria bacterium]|nr:hypothetical protein [Pseudomonadota bacterium]
NPYKYLNIRLSFRISCCLFRAVGFNCLKYAVLTITLSLVSVCCTYADEKELSDNQARQQCFKGKTIYCLALGIKEEKSGRQERALELYRTACRKHPSPGHLRACTPLLNLAWKMNRLDEEAAPLETRCREEKPAICFYLGQEYLKLVEMEKAARHLEPLCRNHFRPPDPANYGPCYHLAKGYEQAGKWYRARELFQFDCESHPEKGQPSCVALKELAEMEKVHQELAQKGIRSADPVEGVLFFVVFISVLNMWIWLKGGRWGLKYLSLGAPLLVWGSALTWVYWPEKPEFPASQWIVIYFALLQVSGMAIFAFRKLQSTHISR